MKISKKSLFSFLFLMILVFGFCHFSLPAKADASLYNNQVGMTDVQTVYGNKQPQDVRIMAVKIINVALGFLTLIFLGLTIYAGFQWMTSGGSEEQVKEAQKLLKNAVMGLIILLVSWALTRYLVVVLSRTIVNQAVNYPFY
jgi:amino acid transporter